MLAMDKHVTAQSYPNPEAKNQPPSSSTVPTTTGRSRTGHRRRSSKDPDATPDVFNVENSLQIMTIGQFKIDPLKSLGEGSYAKVCTATHLDSGRVYACKIINEKKEMGNFIERFLPRELKLMRKFNSERVTCVYGIFKTHNLYYILMDYCENGDLLRYLQKKAHALEEDEVKDKAVQMLLGVQYLHEEALVAHRDLKCENILIDGQNKLKLADFGFARSCVQFPEGTENEQLESRIIKDFMSSPVATLPVLDGQRRSRRLTTDKTTEQSRAEKVPISSPATTLAFERALNSAPRASGNGASRPVESTTFCGSVAYAAPEVLSRKSYDPKKYDMWSAGVIVFIMSCFFMPFDDSDQAKMIRRQQAKKWRYPPNLHLTDALKDFLECLMEPSPKLRLSIGDALKHKWLRKAYRELLESELKNDS